MKNTSITTITILIVLLMSTSVFAERQNPSDSQTDLISTENFTKSASNDLAPQSVSTTLVVSQVKVAGTGGAADEFVEIHNVGSSPIALSGYKIVYRAAAGTNDLNLYTFTSGTIDAGGYFLIVGNQYSGSEPGNAMLVNNLATGGGGVAVRDSSNAIVDGFGYGTATNAFVEGTASAAPAAGSSQARKAAACTDTDNNSNDFAIVNPSTPRNGSSPVNLCVAFTSANDTTFNRGAAGSFQVTTVGTPFVTSITGTGTLPDGVTFTDHGNGTATFAGTPAQAGIFDIFLTASNGVSPNATQAFTLRVNSPTTTSVSVAGKVRAGKSPVSNVTVILTGGNLPEPKQKRTNTFGNYKFEGLTAGQIYVVTVVSKRYNFPQPSIVLNVSDNIADADFEAEER